MTHPLGYRPWVAAALSLEAAAVGSAFSPPPPGSRW